MGETTTAPVALITGGSRGIGAATALALADRGYNLAITYRNKAARAQEVVSQIMEKGTQAFAVACDITRKEDRERLFDLVGYWHTRLDVLVLNASGGMERDAVAENPDYPMLINRDAQIATLDAALPLMAAGSVVVFVTSHWAHLYGQIEQIPAYEPVAESKYAGEQAIRERLPELTARGIRLVVVTGDLIEGTITPKLLERGAPGLAAERRNALGGLPTAADMATAIVDAAMDSSLPASHLVVVGGELAAFTHS